jgi:integrase
MKVVGSESNVVSRDETAANDQLLATNFLETLPRHKIEALMKRLSKIKKKKYLRNHERKYGNLNKGFTEAELRHFFNYCKNPKAHLAFQLMANLGLRVGEVVKIKIDDINFFKNKIKIETEKAGTIDFMHLHIKVRKLLQDWVQKFQEDIINNDGYILFTNDQQKTNSHGRHISPHWLRREFRDICYLAGLNESYGVSEERYEGKRVRKLYRLTTHSLRHYFITRVYKNSKNPIFTQRLGRHKDFKSTETYIHTEQNEIDDTMRKAFEQEDIIVKNDEFEEFITFYKIWKSMKEKD